MFHRRRTRIASAILIVIVIAVSVGLVVRDKLPGNAVDPGTPAPASDVLSPDEKTFYAFVSPRLRALAAESAILVSLGQSRSRNLVELQRRADRVENIGTQLDAYLTKTTAPDRFADEITIYRQGIETVRQAQSDFRTAFLSFDWDAVATSVDEMATGTRDLEQARDQLELSAGVAVTASPTA